MSKRVRLEQAARQVLVREGLSGFTMERLAEAADVSRPTVYQYFKSREGALATTAERTMQLCESLFAAARTFAGTCREQAMAYMSGFEILARFEPDHLETLEFLGMPWIKAALPDETLERLSRLVTGYNQDLLNLLERAVANGELVLPAGYAVRDAVFHSLNFYHGIFLAVARRRISLQLHGSEQPWDISRQALFIFWDGIGWKHPLSPAQQENLHDRILRHCYPEYWLRMKTAELRRGLDPALPEPAPEPLPPARSRKRPKPATVPANPS